jgi:hypothetical protein
VKAGARVDASGVGNHLSLPLPTLQAIVPCTSNAPEPSTGRPQSAALFVRRPVRRPKAPIETPRAGRRLALWLVSSQSSASCSESGRRLNRSLARFGVRCSELALHSVPAQSPQTTNAQCARGEEPKATEFDCRASSCWIDWAQAIRVPHYQRQAYAASGT